MDEACFCQQLKFLIETQRKIDVDLMTVI